MIISVSMGIDVSKARLDVSTNERYFSSYANTDAGRAQFVADVAARHAQSPISRICVESTGSYSLPVVEALVDADLPVCHVPPQRVRKFAESEGILAKTDRIDALMIARFGAQVRNVRPYVKPAPASTALRALVSRREQVIEDRVREQGRLEATADPYVIKRIEKHISVLRTEEEEIEQAIKSHVQSDEDLRARSEAMTDVTGIGITTSARLLAYVPELGTMSRKAIAALCGVAPYDHSSGPTEGKKRRRGGRRIVADLLYYPVLAAIRHNEHIRTFYRRLIANGKPTAVARTACIRKLLVRLNTVLSEFQLSAPAPAEPA